MGRHSKQTTSPAKKALAGTAAAAALTGVGALAPHASAAPDSDCCLLYTSPSPRD